MSPLPTGLPATPSRDLLVLHPDDNVAVLKRPAAEGSLHRVGEVVLRIEAALGMGHKIALRPIPKGADVLKYGAPIGFAACDIAPGAHVHLHNLTSRHTVIQDMDAPTDTPRTEAR